MRKPNSPALVRAALAGCSLLAICSSSFVSAADEAGRGEARRPDGTVATKSDWNPPLRPASDAGERAIQRMKVPAGLKISLWAAEPMMANPNAFCIDEQGRVYVAETYRYHGGVIDSRGTASPGHPLGWVPEDIACRTVEDRVAMVKRHANEAPGKEAIDSPDSERIVLLQDTTGSGKADKSTVFSTGYNRIEDGLGSGVLAHHGNVYYTCIPSLYLLKDTKGTGKADFKQELQYGYGVRYAFLGHDLHGLVVGPDGRLYFSIGDRGANVTRTPDGRQVQNIECGGVFRCDLDGTNLELFATGLRNPQELRFDQYGNLFTGDNNPDKGDPARWVYVVEDGDTGWREGYQNNDHLANGGPWMAEQLWASQGNCNAAYIVPSISPMGAGPSGLAYYPGVGLPSQYDNHFFLCDFRGNANGSLIRSIAVKPKGAGFDVAEEKPFMEHICATDCDFGPDGALYVSDWIDGWDRPMAGRLYKVYDPTKVDDALVKETKKLIAEGMSKRPVDELTKLLSHRDMRVRQEAQFALAAKGPASIRTFSAVAQKGGSLVLPRLHAIWGLGQIARQSPEATKALVPLLADRDVEVRSQAAKVLGDAGDKAAAEPLLKLLGDGNARVRFFAAQALGKLGDKRAIQPLLEALKQNADQDPVLRHGCVNALAKLKAKDALAAAVKSDSRAVRLGAVLALRKLESPAIATFLKDKDGQVVLEAARAINDLPIVEALPQLAAMLDQPLPASTKKAEQPASGKGPGPTGTPADWILWRAVNANFRLGTPEGAQALAKFAARSDAPAAVRAEGLLALGEWGKPSALDHVTNLYRPLPVRDAKPAREAVAAVIDSVTKNSPPAVQKAAAKLMRSYGLGDPATLAKTVADTKAPADVRIAALNSLADRKDAHLADAIRAAMSAAGSGAGNEEVRAAAIRLLAVQPGGVKELTNLLESGSTSDRQAAFGGLGAATDPEADALLARWMDRLAAKQVPAEVQLDLLDAAEKRQNSEVSAKLKQYESTLDPKNPLSPYLACESGGNAENGRHIFRERADVSCIRCHTAQGEGGVVGPKLDGVGTRQNREYLLESLVAPNAKIAPGFESVIVKTKEGKFRVGIVKKDDDKELVLLNPDAEPDKQVVTIPKSEIATRERGPSAMPEGLVRALSKQDLRDLIEFLASLKEEKK